ncbi:hypothetical protein JHU04_001707 [Brenneria sp. 4F2]|uniref:hypothetical protein n=1 Tax=Pectobacterium actinidiae TaxID=1507808 RepID=UPI001EFB5A54|nr:hypothetical protein [Brenneria bubanii]
MSEIERDILTFLFKSSAGLDAFTLFKRVKIPFSEFSKALFLLSDKNFVEESREEFYKITPAGRNMLSSVSSNKKNANWREIPERFREISLPVNSYYVPSIKLLDKDTFNVE